MLREFGTVSAEHEEHDCVVQFDERNICKDEACPRRFLWDWTHKHAYKLYIANLEIRLYVEIQ